MTLLTITFNTPAGIAPVTARDSAVEETVTRYLKRVTAVDLVRYDATSQTGSAFLGAATVAVFRTTPLGGDA